MFILSKVVGALTDPITVFYLLMALGCLLLHSSRRATLGRRILVVTLGLVAVPAVLPLERWLMVALENRFPLPVTLPEHIDGIIVLGGAANPVVSAARGQVALNSAATRLTALVPLANRHSEARLIFTGGSGSMLEQDLKEAKYIIDFYNQIGFDAGRVIFEDQSRNTRENALFSKDLMAPKPGETWVLITSALHMARAVGCFRAVGWPVIAYPTDYQTTGQSGWKLSDLRFSPGGGLAGLRTILHEALGLIGYRLQGWTDTLLPMP
ncbi:MAG: YdcF family protein [Phaeospirillum sp.]|nr:YdcF family protein [Phaeospirillum sp.]